MQHKVDEDAIGQLAANTIRMLAVDAIQKADSGHPGMPMGMADCAYVLWSRYIKVNPEDPKWSNRDRFVLSAGHGSMLLYALLYLMGFDVSLDDLKQFRQWESRTPGHPEYGRLPGVETTTGPLGQGFANGVGMALAAKIMAEKFNCDDFSPVDHRVYGILSDGDLMEGVSSEAASLAGHLRLGNLIYMYDDNRITIEGSTQLAFSENVEKRFQAYGWHTESIDGHDHRAIAKALESGIAEKKRPTLILARTHIGFGSPNKQDKESCHGAPLGEEEVIKTKEKLGWPLDPTFFVPKEVERLFQHRVGELQKLYIKWQSDFKAWKKQHPDLAELWQKMDTKKLPETLEEQLIEALPDKAAATRILGGKILQKAVKIVPSLYGGSADLGPSAKTYIEDAPSIGQGNFLGRNLHFGVREHGMGGILNGIALYGAFIPYGSTFLVFSDYMRPALRLAAIMKIQVITIFSHDSIFVGEDGPTHQPVEHLAALRAIPNLAVIRPADGFETAMAWAFALRRKDGPTALCLSRQTVPMIARSCPSDARNIQKGGYIVSKEKKIKPDVVLVASGSELALAMEAKTRLHGKGMDVRVISMPSLDLFYKQSKEYRDSIVPEIGIPVVVVEAGVEQGWHAITRSPLLFIGLHRFGVSAPYHVLAEKFGFTGESVAEKILHWLKEVS